VPRARTIWKTILAIVASLVLVAVAFIGYTVHVMHKTFETSATRARAALAAHRDEFMEDQRWLASLPMFAPRSGNRDAGSLIGPRVHWIVAGSPSAEPLALDPTAIDKLGDGWVRAGPDVWGAVDLGLMAHLGEYDFWDVDRNSVPPGQQFSMDAEPSITDLAAWAKLRIAKGVHDGALGSAVADVQELARLCFTAERFETQMAGLATLGILRQARERLGAAVPAPAAERESIARVRRAIFGARAFARLQTAASYEGDFAQIAMGRCAALYDGSHTALLLRAQLREARPADYQHVERLLASSPECRLGSVRRRWAVPDDERLSEPKEWWDRMLMHRIPAYRRFIGETLLAISEQDWFKQYEKGAP
jgi:hypothetical protein